MTHQAASRWQFVRKSQTIRPALALCAALFAACAVPVARAQDETITRLNEGFRGIEDTRRSDRVLLPTLAKMEAPPAAVASVSEARLLPADAAAFAQASAWAEAAPQQLALSALAGVTKESDWRKAGVFSQPYGTDGVTPDMIRAGLYTELGDPPTLAWASMGYLPAFDRLEVLANVEATRLAGSGKPNEAIDVLINFAFFARQICDRHFFEEARWGLRALSRTMERVRDIAYTDTRGPKAMDTTRIKAQLDRMGEHGVLDLTRMKWPKGNRLGASQMVQRLYGSDGSIRADLFPSTMARLGTGGKPLRLFSESARWRTSAGQQVNGATATEKVQKLYGDWERRWAGDYHDRVLQGRTMVYAETDKTSHAVVALATPDMSTLIQDRQQAITELVGTRQSLALTAMWYRAGAIPRQVSVVSPQWLPSIEADPYNPDLADTRKPAPVYFIPTQRGGSETIAHPMNIVTSTQRGNANFNLNLKNDVFVLYSMGTDLADNGAGRIENTISVVQGADYLLWPPVLSLYRQNLRDRGDIQ